MKPLIQKGAQSLDDADALEIKSIYPVWNGAAAYDAGDKVQCNGKLYRCLQAHTSQADWTPDVTASLWTVIDEEHKGTADDPVLYSGNMVLNISENAFISNDADSENALCGMNYLTGTITANIGSWGEGIAIREYGEITKKSSALLQRICGTTKRPSLCSGKISLSSL